MTPSTSSALLRRLPLGLLLVAGGLAWAFYGDTFSFQALAENRDRLLALRDGHYLVASLIFVAVYVAAVAISLPGGLVLTLTGGFLFGLFPGLIYNVAGATAGAVVVFLAARAGFGQDVAQSVAARGGRAARVMESLRDNAWPVLLSLRLMPVVPFFLANLLPAFVGVRLSTFAVTTALGIVPAGAVYTQIGAGLGEILAKGEAPDLALLAEPRFALPLAGLAALALLPLAVKLWRRR